MLKSIGTEYRRVVVGGGGWNGKLACHGNRVSVWGDENVLETGGGDGGITAGMCLLQLNCILKTGSLVNSLLPLKKKKRKLSIAPSHGGKETSITCH